MFGGPSARLRPLLYPKMKTNVSGEPPLNPSALVGSRKRALLSNLLLVCLFSLRSGRKVDLLRLSTIHPRAVFIPWQP